MSELADDMFLAGWFTFVKFFCKKVREKKILIINNCEKPQISLGVGGKKSFAFVFGSAHANMTQSGCGGRAGLQSGLHSCN